MADDRKPQNTSTPFQKVEVPVVNGAQTSQADFERNREGIYGGRPEVRGAEPVPER